MLSSTLINLPVAQIHATWSGEKITRNDYHSIQADDFFTLPFLFFNFLPEVSLTQATALQFWLGFQFLTANLNLKVPALATAFQTMRFQLLGIVNKTTTKCILKRKLAPAQKYESKALGPYLAASEYTDLPESAYHWNFFFSRPFLIPVRCLNKPGTKNTLEISWRPLHNSAKFAEATGKLRVDFVLPPAYKVDRARLYSNLLTHFRLPSLMWLRFRLGTTVIKSELASHQFTFQSAVAKNYPFLMPFDGLFTLKIQAWERTILFQRLLQRSLNLSKWFETLLPQLQFHFPFFALANLKTTVYYKNKLQHNLAGSLVFHGNTLPPASKWSFFHRLKTNPQTPRHLLPTIINQIQPRSLLLTAKTNPYLVLLCSTKLQLNDRFKLQFTFEQTLQFKNYWNHLGRLQPLKSFRFLPHLTVFYCLKFVFPVQVSTLFVRASGGDCV